PVVMLLPLPARVPIHAARAGARAADGSASGLANVLRLLRAGLLVGAPARIDAIGPADEDRLDAADLLALDLEQLAQLPGPVDRPVIDEGEGEDDAPLAVHGHEAAVADAGDGADQRLLQLLLAALHRLAAQADGARRADDDHAVLMPQ